MVYFFQSGAIVNHMVNYQTYNLNDVFHALSDPTRRAILERLSHKSLSVSELAKPFKVSLVAISKHIKVLENAKLISRQKAGRISMCQVNEEAMMSAEEWLSHYSRFWTDKMEALDEFVKTANKGDKKC